MEPPKELKASMLKARWATPAWLNVDVNAVMTGCILSGGSGSRKHLDIRPWSW